VEKYFRVGQATDDMTHAQKCWITKATNTHSENVLLIFPLQKWFIRTLPVLFKFVANLHRCNVKGQFVFCLSQTKCKVSDEVKRGADVTVTNGQS
jgi:hypothetical protein